MDIEFDSDHDRPKQMRSNIRLGWITNMTQRTSHKMRALRSQPAGWSIWHLFTRQCHKQWGQDTPIHHGTREKIQRSRKIRLRVNLSCVNCTLTSIPTLERCRGHSLYESIKRYIHDSLVDKLYTIRILNVRDDSERCYLHRLLLHLGWWVPKLKCVYFP